jgi:excisionase family DNA binding protein
MNLESKRCPVEKTDLLSRAEAAAYLGIKAQTLAVWSCTKRYGIAMVKIGRLAKYRRSDLDAFIASRTVRPI